MRRKQDELSAVPDLRLALSFDRDFDNSLKEIYHPSQSDRSWTTMPELVDVTDSPVAWDCIETENLCRPL